MGEIKNFHCKGNVSGEIPHVLSTFETLEKNYGVEVLVTLARSYMKGEIIELEASIELTKAFTEQEEFWIIRKMFLGGSEFVVTLEFPQSKIPSEVAFCKLPVSDNKDFQTLVPLETNSNDDSSPKKSSFLFKTTEINIGQSLVAKWRW
jgi:hypothetical protein